MNKEYSSFDEIVKLVEKRKFINKQQVAAICFEWAGYHEFILEKFEALMLA